MSASGIKANGKSAAKRSVTIESYQVGTVRQGKKEKHEVRLYLPCQEEARRPIFIGEDHDLAVASELALRRVLQFFGTAVNGQIISRSLTQMRQTAAGNEMFIVHVFGDNGQVRTSEHHFRLEAMLKAIAQFYDVEVAVAG
jgi:hypothetical protein